jgi:hypothetical protein
MARNARTGKDVRRDIATEREQLAEAVDELRADLDVGDKLRAKLPALAAGAVGAGFVVAGGVGATMRLLARRGREGKEKARVGPFSFVQRR